MPIGDRRNETPKTRSVDWTLHNVIILILVITGCIVLVSGFGFFLYELSLGNASIPARVIDLFWALIVAVITIGTGYIQTIKLYQKSDQNNRRTQNEVQEVKRILNGDLDTRIDNTIERQLRSRGILKTRETDTDEAG